MSGMRSRRFGQTPLAPWYVTRGVNAACILRVVMKGRVDRSSSGYNLRLAAFRALALWCCAVTVAAAEGVPGGCERFRSGELVRERIEDFDLADPDRADVSFIELRYDPAYLRDPAIPPRPDGLPDREQLFSLDALAGTPLTARDRRGRTSLGQQGTVNVMVQGDRSVIDIDAVLRAVALAPLDAPYRRTGELLAGFERLDIPSGLWTAEDALNGKDVFARLDAAGRAEAVMSCY